MLQNCCANLHEKIMRQLNLFIGFDQDQNGIKGTVIVSRTSGRSCPGKSTTFRLYSSTLLDPDTGRGVLSGEASLRNGKKTKHGKIETVTYSIKFQLEPEFGIPGAIVVRNGDRAEFFLQSVMLQMSDDDHNIQFNCNSWVYPVKNTNADRIFFANTSYLPSKTPAALWSLRQEELASLRGNGTGERKEWDRIYDYDRYNDLGEPDKGVDHVRPVLGGSKAFPYPRRCRTGRPLSKDGATEVRNKLINLDFYVPPDDRFSPVKLSAFISNSIRAILHFVVPEVKSFFERDVKNFESFDQITEDLYRRDPDKAVEVAVIRKLKSFLPEELFKQILGVVKENPVKFPIPQVIAADKDAWRRDEEFAREMLAGLNPTVIRRLEKFPPEGRGGKMSSIAASHIAKELDGFTVRTAMNAGRIFILDHHDYLMPYLNRINAQGVCTYASRTLLFLKDDGTLKPLAIELSLPGDNTREDVHRVFLPARDGAAAALWQLAKTHVAVNDSGYHQLISHWLNTHAAVEPFIIATRRQLSSMHPIYKLLDPHFKDTLHINSLARSVLLNSGGVLERTMFPGKSAMELSSKIYQNWRFIEQGLPADLLKRGLAVKDPAAPSGVRLLLKDYPYASDGLDVWTAIKTWINNYCAHFYLADGDVATDAELQSWWKEIREVGHGDRRDDAGCWITLDSVSNLVLVLTTFVWIASALHAAVNFGQWGYAGFPLNRPTRCRKFIPDEGTPEFVELLRNPDEYFLRTVPDRFTTTLGLALIEVLSGHAGDEVYLGQRAPATAEWTDDAEVRRMFEEFGERLRLVERRIEERNKEPRLKNRYGPAKVPYTLLYPDTSNMGAEKGVTGKGIPNSVSI